MYTQFEECERNKLVYDFVCIADVYHHWYKAIKLTKWSINYHRVYHGIARKNLNTMFARCITIQSPIISLMLLMVLRNWISDFLRRFPNCLTFQIYGLRSIDFFNVKPENFYGKILLPKQINSFIWAAYVLLLLSIECNSWNNM